MRALVLTVAAAAATTLPATAQVDGSLTPGWVFDVETSERLVGGAQLRDLVAWRSDRMTLTVDSVVPGGAGLRLWLAPNSVQSLELELRADGHFVTGRFHDRPGRTFTHDGRVDSIAFHAGRLHTRGGQVTFQETRAWDVLPVLKGPLEPGATWTDTVDVRVARDEHLEAWRGVRTYTVVGDTTVEGRRRWRIRESMELAHESRGLERDRSFDDLRVRSRAATGSQTGVLVVDAVTRRLVSRVDTLSVEGPQEIILPDGRAFASRATWERIRRMAYHDPGAASARADSIRRATRYGGVRALRPGDSLSPRLMAQDPALIDSLTEVAAGNQGGRSRVEAVELLRNGLQPWSGSTAWRDVLLELGDTTRALTAALNGTIDDDDVSLLLPFIEDPARLHDHGLRSEELLGGVRNRLLARPPGVPPLPRDIGPAACTPSACETLGTLVDNRDDPRVTDLGWIARFVVDPVAWVDSLATRRSSFTEEARRLATGIGLGPFGTPVPGVDAGVDAWAAWMDWPEADSGRRVRWPSTATHAIRFAERLQGRDVVGELRARFDAGTDERSRGVFGYLLSRLGERLFEPDELGGVFREGFESDQRLVLGQIERPGDSPFPWEPAPPEEVEEIASRFLAILFDGAEPWADGGPFDIPRLDWFLGESLQPVLARADNVPLSVRERWADRIDFVDEARARAAPAESEEGVRLFLEPIAALGELRRAQLSYTTYRMTDFREGPQLYRSHFGHTVVLMREGDDWVVLSAVTGRGH